jgi:alkaline phosphatase
MKNSFKILFLVSFVSLVSILVHAKPKHPKRVILMIGDGMGLAQISGALSNYAGQNAFERFKVIGFSKTASADNYVTDSGAGATAFSIGKKAKNGAIGVDENDQAQVGLFELIKKAKGKTGVVATSSITHATPASFFAHVVSRNSEADIAKFLLNENCDFAIGGGTKFIFNRTDSFPLDSLLKAKGFELVKDSVFKKPASAKFIYTLAADGMKTMKEGRGNYLTQASELAFEQLENNSPALVMIEGSQIDWGGHANDFDYMKAELIDFNQSINLVLDKAMKDKETLVIVTADHETGGLSLLKSKNEPFKFEVNYASNGHSGIMVPVFAFGPGAEHFAGIYENTAIFQKIKSCLKLK